MFRPFVYFLLFCVAVSLSLSAVAEQGRASGDFVARMNKVYQIFRELPRYARDEAKFNAPENEEKIQGLLDSLQANFHGPTLWDSDVAEDAGFQATLSTLQDLLADTTNRFRDGRKNYARWRVKTITNYCISCHSRYEVEVDYQGQDIAGADVSHFERAEFLFATRQFDDAAREYIKAAQDPTTPLRKMESLRNWLVIVTRVHPDPRNAIRVLTKLRADMELAPYEDEEVRGWLSSLRRWQNERSIKISNLRRAENLIRRAEVMRNSPRDGAGTVEYLRATSLLHQDLEGGDLTDEKRGHALLLLGKAYSVMPDVFASELPDLFLSQCIKLVPDSEDARSCYRIHYNNVVVGFSGSGGTRIPDDVKLNLRELYNIAFGIKTLENRI